MRRRRLALALAAALLVLAAPAAAYQLLSQDIGGTFEGSRWQTLPVNLVVDNGPTDVSGEIATAVGAWNAVPTARDPFGTVTKAAVDFDASNLNTAWGNLTGDGSQEVVVDETGSAIRALGLNPADVNGFGPRHETLVNGHAVIDDMFLILNASRSNFDRQATEVHELGHTIGIAHSSAGWSEGRDGALDPLLESQVPTMFPFSIAGDGRRTLEADDRAAVSELYPEPSFTTTTGTLTGTVTRCGNGEPVLGANVVAVSVSDPTVQVSRVTGFDGRLDGSYTIHGLPPGEYRVVVEPLSGDDEYLDRLAMYTDQIDTDFTQELFNDTEGDCAQDTDPNAADPVPVGASGTKTADFKVEGASLALVVDITGSMGPEIGAVKAGLDTMITALEAVPGDFPKTTIVTFDDASQIATVSRDPDRLRQVIDGLTVHSTADCPEGSNRALMTAGRLLGSGGRAVLVTDANSHPTGPTREMVDTLFAAKGARLSVLLSGECPAPPPRPGAGPARAAPSVVGDGSAPDEARPADALGFESPIRTFSEESLFSGGVFSFQPGIKTGQPDAVTRYSDTLANIGISSVRPAVAALEPATVPRGTTLDVELTGSNTGFRPGSTVAVAGGGVTVDSVSVLSPSSIVARVTATAGAALGFRDVTVSSDRGDGSVESAHGIGALQVTGAPSGPTVLSVTPSRIPVGATRDVTISGGLTHFAANSVAALGAGVTVNHLTVRSPTEAVASVSVGSGAAIGFRDVTVTTGGELAGESVPGPLLLVAAPPPVPRLTSASPASGQRGTTVDVALQGVDTSFAGGTSLASVTGTGIDVLSTTVHSPLSLTARLRISPAAPLGFRDLRVTTGAENAILLDGFRVTPALPVATPTPTPISTPAPPGGGPPAQCADTARPRATLKRPTVKGRRLRLRGGASDTGCGGRLARVEVAVARAAGRRCRFAGAGGRLGKARKCSKPVFLRAKGTVHWSLALRRRLPHGRYTILVRARDAAGNRQAKPAKRTLKL